MARPSAVASRRWASRRSSLHHDHLGRTLTSSASLARFAASVSITSSSSTSVTCEACCRLTFTITTRRERISRSTRIVRRAARYTHPRPATLSRSRRLVVCIIATNGSLLSLSSRPHKHAGYSAEACSARKPPRSNAMRPELAHDGEVAALPEALYARRRIATRHRRSRNSQATHTFEQGQLYAEVREASGRNLEPTVAILDSQSAKAAQLWNGKSCR